MLWKVFLLKGELLLNFVKPLCTMLMNHHFLL